MSNNIKVYSWNIVKICNAHVRLFTSGFEHKVNQMEIVLQSKQCVSYRSWTQYPSLSINYLFTPTKKHKFEFTQQPIDQRQKKCNCVLHIFCFTEEIELSLLFDSV